MKTIKSLFLVFFLIYANPLFSQNQKKIDSLETALTLTQDPKSQYRINYDIWNEYINNNVEKSITYADEIIQIGMQQNNDTILGFGFEKKGTSYAYMSKFDSSEIYYKKSIKRYGNIQNYSGIANAHRNIGMNYHMLGNLDSASTYYNKAKMNYERENDSVGIADINNVKAVANYGRGYYNLALADAIKAEDFFLSKKRTLRLNQNRLLIASLYNAMKDTLTAIDYYKKTNIYFKEQKLNRQLCSNLILILELQIPNITLNTQNKALLQEAYSLAQELKDPTYIYSVDRQFGEFYLINKEYKKARDIFIKSIDKALKDKNDSDFIMSSALLGKTYLAMGQYKKAILILNKAKVKVEALNWGHSKPLIYELLSKSFKGLGNFDKSLDFFIEFKKFNDSIYNSETTNRFNELKIIHETEKKEADLALQEEEINTLNAKAKADRLTKGIYGGSAIGGLALSGLLFFGFRQRMKKNKIEREKLDAELAFKKKELASQTLHLVQKNTFIQELKENLENLKNSPDKFKMEFRRIVMLLKKQNADNKDWEVFKSYFSEVHDNFDKKIKQVYSDISEKELRLASFIKMNLSTKEIAAMLNVLPDSVLKSKYRLKKKLGLGKETDLYGYLINL